MENNSNHFLSASFECHDYTEKFGSNTVLPEHIQDVYESSLKKTRDESPIECPICLTKFTQKNNLGRHMQRLHGAEAPRSYLKKKDEFTLHECSECKIKFTRRSNLLRHQKKFHEFAVSSKLPQQPKIFGCTECDTKFTKWRNCVRHMRNFHQTDTSQDTDKEEQTILVTECSPPATEDENMECVIEVDPFPVISSLRAESNSDAIECLPESESQWDSRLHESGSIQKREATATTNSKLMCSECSTTCSTPFNLRRHMKRFHLEKDGSSNTTPQTQLAVDTVAVKKRPLGDFREKKLFFQMCAECNITFSTSFNMKRHMKRFHQDKMLEPPSSTQPIVDTTEIKKCPLCDFRENRLNLYVHFNLVHGLQVIIEYQIFDSEMQLDEWLSQVKAEAHFIVQKSDSNRMVISCSHSNDSEDFCPAEMIILTESGRCTVHRVKTHVGHEL